MNRVIGCRHGVEFGVTQWVPIRMVSYDNMALGKGNSSRTNTFFLSVNSFSFLSTLTFRVKSISINYIEDLTGVLMFYEFI